MNNKTQQFARTHPRLTGFLVFIVCTAIFYVCMVAPVLQANSGNGVVKINGKYGTVSFLLAALGLVLTFIGHRIAPTMPSSKNVSKTPYIIAGAIVGIASIFAVESFKAYLRSKGYAVL